MAYDATVTPSSSMLLEEFERVFPAASSLNAVAALQLPGNYAHSIAKANKPWFAQALIYSVRQKTKQGANQPP